MATGGVRTRSEAKRRTILAAARGDFFWSTGSLR